MNEANTLQSLGNTPGAAPDTIALPDVDGNALAHRFAERQTCDSIGLQKVKTIRQGCLDLAVLISIVLPPSREQSLAITKVEEAMQWAIKAAKAEPFGRIVELPDVPGDAAQSLPRNPWMTLGESRDPNADQATPADRDAPQAGVESSSPPQPDGMPEPGDEGLPDPTATGDAPKDESAPPAETRG